MNLLLWDVWVLVFRGRKKNKDFFVFPQCLKEKKKPGIRSTHKHPTCLGLIEEGNSIQFVQSNIYNFETLIKWLAKRTHKISVPRDPPRTGAAHQRPCFEYGPCGFCFTRVPLRKPCGNSDFLCEGWLKKPSLNFFILIRNWHRVLTQWKKCCFPVPGTQRHPFPLCLAQVRAG